MHRCKNITLNKNFLQKHTRKHTNEPIFFLNSSFDSADSDFIVANLSPLNIRWRFLSELILKMAILWFSIENVYKAESKTEKELDLYFLIEIMIRISIKEKVSFNRAFRLCFFPVNIVILAK